MFVGEAPGADEDRQGLAFVGAAGQFLTKMIAAMGKKKPFVVCDDNTYRVAGAKVDEILHANGVVTLSCEDLAKI